MSDAHAALQRFADALEAKAKASDQDEEDDASDGLIEAVGDVEQNAAEAATLLRHALLAASANGQQAE